MLDGRDLATRQAILNRLKKNEGKITYEDLVDIGVCEPGTLSENGFVRWLQNFMGGPDIFADMLEKEYQLITDFGMTFGIADQEYRQQFEAQRAMAVTLLIAPALGSLADRMVNGSAKGEFANNTYDNLERFGTKESQNPWKQPEVAGEFIDGIRISVGKVGGKIPVDEFKIIRQSSMKNPDAKSITLGKFTGDETSYTKRAGAESSYFDMGNEWGAIKQKYGLTDNEMFDYFNKPALNDAIGRGKTIRFSHNPIDYEGSFLADEWEYIKGTLKLTDANLVFEGGFWYVR